MKMLRQLRKEHGYTQESLGKLMGVSDAAVSQWESGKREASYEVQLRLAELFDVSVDFLLRGSVANERPVPRQTMIPVLGRVSAGTGVTAEEDVIGYEPADAKYGNGEYFYLQVKGDSMSPKIDDGDMVLVHRQTSVDSGTIGVFSVDGDDGFVKKVEYDTEYIHLISLNPYYPPLVFEGPDVLRVYVLGKVIKLERRF